jgi:hypothetical protein
MKVGSIVIDRAAHEVLLAGASVALTAKEFTLLAYLAERRGKVVSRDELLRRCGAACTREGLGAGGRLGDPERPEPRMLRRRGHIIMTIHLGSPPNHNATRHAMTRP